MSDKQVPGDDSAGQGRWDQAKEQWKRLPRWSQWAVGVLAALVAIGVFVGDEEEGSNEPEAATSQVQSQEPRTESPGSQNQSEAQPSGPTDYKVAVKANRVDDGVSASGTTNLPDGAVINLIASRVFRNQREDEKRTVHVGDATATVEDGSFEAVISDLDEGDLALGVPDVSGPIAEIDSDLTVCAEFRTGEEDGKPRQPNADVRAEVGSSGEELRGSLGATKFGQLTDRPSIWLEAQIHIEYPVAILDEITGAQGNAPAVRPLSKRFCA